MHELKKEFTDKQEMYLKSIYLLAKRDKVARVTDIADSLNVSKSTVSGMLKYLSDKELVNYDPYKFVVLTEKGSEVAQKLIEEYEVIKTFLEEYLGLPEAVAQNNACRMEHILDAVVIESFKERLK